jgi:hypothetical protein
MSSIHSSVSRTRLSPIDPSTGFCAVTAMKPSSTTMVMALARQPRTRPTAASMTTTYTTVRRSPLTPSSSDTSGKRLTARAGSAHAEASPTHT